MSLEGRALAGAQALAARRQRAAIEAIASKLDGIAGIAVASEADAVTIEGRGLVRRWLNDPQLRFVAGAAR